MPPAPPVMTATASLIANMLNSSFPGSEICFAQPGATPVDTVFGIR
jgi:hypothetical protein